MGWCLTGGECDCSFGQKSVYTCPIMTLADCLTMNENL